MAKLDVLRGPFPRLRAVLDFGEFAEELRGNTVEPWLNPSTDWIAWLTAHQAQVEAGELGGEARAAELAALYAELWNCTAEEAGQLMGLHPPLVTWIVDRTWALINAHREGTTGNSTSG